MVLNTLDNNTGHSRNNHNSTASEIPICDFHDSTLYSTLRHTNLKLRR
jgi:hypothetical protein